MLAQRQRPQSIRIRYYLSTEEGLFRIPQRLHQELLEGTRMLPEFASSEQRVLEVVARPLTRSTYVFSARGLVYPFDQTGSLVFDLSDVLDDVLEPVREGNVIHLDRAKQSRHNKRKRRWRPTKTLIDQAKNDIIGTGKPGRTAPLLRPRA
jgi:hypothetical protein